MSFCRRVLFALCVAVCAGQATHLPQAGAQEMTEARLKAALLANLALFIEWPDASGPLRMCVAGRGETVDAVRALDARQSKGRTIEVVPLAAPGALAGRGCHLVFISAGTGARAIEYAQFAAGNAVAIVSEDDVLSLERVHVLIGLEERRPVIEINLTAARKQGLDISSRMLKLARKVV